VSIFNPTARVPLFPRLRPLALNWSNCRPTAGLKLDFFLSLLADAIPAEGKKYFAQDFYGAHLKPVTKNKTENR